MSLLKFLGRRFVFGALTRTLTNFLVKKFRLSPGVGNIIFVVLTELLSRGTESLETAPGAKGARAKGSSAKAPFRSRGFGFSRQ